MFNELIFILQIAIIGMCTLMLQMMGKEALVAYICLLFTMANIFVTKQIVLFGWTVTSADVFIIGVSLSSNILQEFWGKQITQKSVFISFALSLIYLTIGKCIVAYTPSTVDCAQQHLCFVMEHTTRIVIASFIAYITTQMIDIQIYAYLKKLMNGKYFVTRNYISLCSSQLIDTVLFSFLGLWGIVACISDIIIVSYSIKLLAIACTSPFLIIAKRIMKIKPGALSHD